MYSNCKYIFDDINSFLKKYRKLKPPERAIREVVKNYFKNLNLPVKIQNTKIKNRVLYLNLNAAAKHHLYTNKEKAKKFIKMNLPGLIIEEIR